MKFYIPTLEELNTEIARQDFGEFCVMATPQWSWYWKHLKYIRRQVERVTSGATKRLMLFLPPRHGKSEMVTVRYPVWRILSDGQLKVIVGAYNQTLANKFSRKSRRIAKQWMELSDERTAVEDWETTAGGGLRAVGVGGGITGQGGDLIIIDDPVKNREEANSETYRQKVWDWYTDDLYTRLEPGGAIILIMTRWHEDDLAGRILDSDDGQSWEVVNLPAEAEEDDELGRDVGEALCPERFDLKDLARIKRVLGNSYYALYQQRPVAPEGEMFKRAWFEIVDAAPFDAQRIRYWDKAGTADGGAYTAGVLLCYKNGITYIEDVVRGQWASAEREQVIKQTAALDYQRYGNFAPKIWFEQEPGSGGKESAAATIVNLRGYSAFADRITGDKVTRAEPLTAQAMAGNVKMVKGDWNHTFINEITSFPQGRYKDQVDATSGGFNKLAPMYEVEVQNYRQKRRKGRR